jgi:short-subunit dehydrogenase
MHGFKNTGFMYDDGQQQRTVMTAIQEFRRRYGPWALIAGGSKGLGAAFAEELARYRLNLILLARNERSLAGTAAGIRKRHGIEVRTVSVDLAAAGALSKVKSAIGKLEIGLLVYNAAGSYTGAFLSAEPDYYKQMVTTNCTGALELVYWLGARMIERRRGGILLMSSLTAFLGSPFVATYGATKAFLLNLAEGLNVEWNPFGVDVAACCAGPIRTPSYLRSKPAGKGPRALEMEPGQVACKALRALGRRTIVIPGVLNRFVFLLVSRVLSRTAATRLLARSTRSMYGNRATDPPGDGAIR